VLEIIRIDAWFLSRKDGVRLKIQEGSLAYCGPKRIGVFSVTIIWSKMRTQLTDYSLLFLSLFLEPFWLEALILESFCSSVSSLEQELLWF
jgi:hypothetical protein